MIGFVSSSSHLRLATMCAIPCDPEKPQTVAFDAAVLRLAPGGRAVIMSPANIWRNLERRRRDVTSYCLTCVPYTLYLSSLQNEYLPRCLGSA